ncbi:MAG TPA: hypothetical protein VF181_10820 [Balneolaceae bacterium]
MKKKYFFIGLILLLVALLGYHFFAASEAERQIDKTIQEQTAKSDSISVQYSSVEVAPFSGKISFSDLTVIFKDHIQRAQQLIFDIGYIDFLNIYFGGLAYGLDHLDQANITLRQPSYLNQQSLYEVKMDTLQILYQGNALDAILAMAKDTALAIDHSVKAHSSRLTLRFPETLISGIVARNFSYSGMISEGKNSYWKGAIHQFSTDSLIWRPSESFQNTYRFFIQGFGYQSDAIPFQSLRFYSEPVSQKDTLHVKTRLQSELAQFLAKGFINLNKPIGSSELNNMEIKISELSTAFERVLQNVEQLLSISLPSDSTGIVLEVTGTLGNPRLSTQ